ncbi:MAG: hypothetical protein M2R45_00197 [Verrucomicrobia subdivision 3 bacterium]|nr:hypothetical protein [Limisphaerales bacterium]MCS1412344.1 hypothetical protein [Limisphaerales bacterium]
MQGRGRVLWIAYSSQDAILEANIRGDHEYGARLADLVVNLKKLFDMNLTLTVSSTRANHSASKSRYEAVNRTWSGSLPQFSIPPTCCTGISRKIACGCQEERILGKGARISI